MLNFDSDMPYFYRTFDRLGDLEQGHSRYAFDGSVWKVDMIFSYDVGEAHLTFDSPAEWAKGLPPAKFQQAILMAVVRATTSAGLPPGTS